MSGIAGIIHFDGAPVEPGQIEKMTSAMAHRGPDGIHHWVKGNVALGQCMLRTTPESLEETQPLTNEDESLVLVMDGRVDNWEELRRELLGRGALLRTRSDAELVLRAFEIWGGDFLLHIDGDFALVLWDVKKRSAFCARDRMGSKPINYHWDGKTFTFASDLHALLLLPWVKRELNDGMLAEFVAAEWHSRDETLWKGIWRLVAAHQMNVSSAGPHLEQYWEPGLREVLPYTKDEEYVEHYRELVTDSVRRLSRTQRPLAIEVSGGLDSSAVYGIAEHLRRANHLLAPGIAGYTLAFVHDARANELEYARGVGEFWGSTIHEIPPSIFPLTWFEARAHAWHDFPGFANGTMAQGLLERASVDGSRAIFNGVGGDEWLAGSRAYYAEELAQHHRSILYDCFKKDALEFGNRQALTWLFRYGIFPSTPLAFQQSLKTIVSWTRGNGNTGSRQYWLSREMREKIVSRRKPTSVPSVSRAGQLELLATRNDAYLAMAREEAERLYAGFGLEARRPLHTAEFVQFAFSTPERLRLQGGRDKFLHVQAMRGLMPRSILDRTIKAEFSVMFRDHLDRMKVLLTETIPGEHPNWVTHAGMDRLFKAYQNNPKAGWPLWILWSIHGCHIMLTKQGSGNI